MRKRIGMLARIGLLLLFGRQHLLVLNLFNDHIQGRPAAVNVQSPSNQFIPKDLLYLPPEVPL